MSLEHRPWTHHLRLLPGGEADAASGVVGTVVVFGGLVYVELIALKVLLDVSRTRLDPLLALSLVGAFPCAVIALWLAIRIQTTQPIALDEAAAWPAREKVYYGDELPRVPRAARIVSLRPRRVTLRLIDERPFVLTFRANDDPDDLLALACALLAAGETDLEALVRAKVEGLAGELLPDIEGIREALAAELLPLGVVVTRGEVV